MPILPDLPQAELAIVELTNAFRREQKLGVAAGESALTKAAREYARFLSATSVFSHEADGRRSSDRIAAAGYAACATAENLAWMSDSAGFETRDLAIRMVEGWKKSPPHRKNLMLQHVTDTGVAIAKVTGAEKYIAVQLFGRPLARQFKFEIHNDADRTVGFVMAGKRVSLQPRGIIRYTVCEPAEIAIEVVAGGLLAKAEVQRFTTEGGRVYKLTKGAGGVVKVDVETVKP